MCKECRVMGKDHSSGEEPQTKAEKDSDILVNPKK